jgi:hypothetical protein
VSAIIGAPNGASGPYKAQVHKQLARWSESRCNSTSNPLSSLRSIIRRGEVYKARSRQGHPASLTVGLLTRVLAAQPKRTRTHLKIDPDKSLKGLPANEFSLVRGVKKCLERFRRS